MLTNHFLSFMGALRKLQVKEGDRRDENLSMFESLRGEAACRQAGLEKFPGG
jgi:hypothetical protein